VQGILRQFEFWPLKRRLDRARHNFVENMASGGAGEDHPLSLRFLMRVRQAPARPDPRLRLSDRDGAAAPLPDRAAPAGSALPGPPPPYTGADERARPA
jgi:hypothetical protein